jgi:hypothetical protein
MAEKNFIVVFCAMIMKSLFAEVNADDGAADSSNAVTTYKPTQCLFIYYLSNDDVNCSCYIVPNGCITTV